MAHARLATGHACALALALLAAAALAACTGAPPAGQPFRWQSGSGHATPTLADSSDCRFQARRQAEMRFPDRVLDVPSGPGKRTSVTLPSDGDRLAADIRFYAQCMRHKGFELVDTAST
jgi:hypothetical protein